MFRFVHIDHCLCHVGGHEYEYAASLLGAAEKAGYEVILAANRRFREGAQLPDHWPVYPVFPFTAYTKHSVWHGGHEHLPLGLAGEPLADRTRNENGRSLRKTLAAGLARVANLPRQFERSRRIRGFAQACERLFEQIQLCPDDHVFFATMTEFDLLGLTRYLVRQPQAPTTNWHIQFHFGLYGGCPPEASARAARRQAVRQHFEFVLQQLPHQNIRFYNTTEQLAAQYNRLNVGRFRYMPYAVSPAVHAPTEATGGRLRVTCAGAARRDKRIQELKHIVRAVRSDPFFDQKIEIVAQLSRRKSRRLGLSSEAAADDKADVPFRSLPHPLEPDAYHELIRAADIGLFLHDNQRYLSQCSGVLHEMLAAGKPVIVPGGCWLASQVAEPIFAHIENLCATLPALGCWAGADLKWRRRLGTSAEFAGGDELAFAGEELAETRLPLSAAATEVVVGFRWSNRTAGNYYVGVQVEQLAGDGTSRKRVECIVGQRRGDGPALAIFRLEPGVDQIAVSLRNFHDDRRIAVSDVQVRLLRAGGLHACPSGSVGLIAAQPAQIPECLRDIVAHYSHYRESAAAYSRTWCQVHHPSQTIGMLTGTS